MIRGPQIKTQTDRALWRWVKFAMTLLVLCILLIGTTVGAIGFAVAMRAHNDLRSQCAVWHDVGSSPVATTTSPLGLHLVADGRAQFQRLDCASQYGPLPPPDPRVAAIMLTLGG
ncbi:hypothetical protein SAMN05444157_1634 [Frankineae bacterium MT45]|nr:hypothetical protein SAMN05444157_1634 [Frankineae bacterium MT45]